MANCAEMEIAILLIMARAISGKSRHLSVRGMPRIIMPNIAAHDIWNPMSIMEAGIFAYAKCIVKEVDIRYLKLRHHTVDIYKIPYCIALRKQIAIIFNAEFYL